jgi:hypothetical protein
VFTEQLFPPQVQFISCRYNNDLTRTVNVTSNKIKSAKIDPVTGNEDPKA